MKDIEWSLYYGEGDIVCTCDYCNREERFCFEDNKPDFKKVHSYLVSDLGWTSCKDNGTWLDFCSEICRNAYFKNK